MADISKKSTRIAKNTLVLSIRMIILMLVNLYTSRVILSSLGVEDYGIYNVVAGFITMFQSVSVALVNASSRFINYEMGKGDGKHLMEVFTTALNVNIGIALAVMTLAETIGLWYINNIMVLPPERLFAANICYQMSIFNFCLILINIPYRACIIAHEKMKTFAYVSIIEGSGQLAISYLILWNPFDRLIYYALMLFLLQNMVRYIYQNYCRKHFYECHYIKYYDVKMMKEILGFSSWNMFGNGATIIKTHGGNLILNLFFGPSVNAARGLANHVYHAVSGLVTNFLMAVAPQITQSYAKKDYKYMLSLMNKGSLFSFYLLLLICLPLIINADFILRIWLKSVPEYTVTFVQLSLVTCILYGITRPLVTGQNATGNVKKFQLVIGIIELLNLPISYIVLFLGGEPYLVLWVAVIMEFISVLLRIYMLPKTIPFFSPVVFIKKILIKCAIVTIVCLIIPILMHYNLEHNICSSLANIFVSIICTFVTIYFIGISKNEKEWLIEKVKNVVRKK